MSPELMRTFIAIAFIGTFITLIMMILLLDLGTIETHLSAFLLGMWQKDVRRIFWYYFRKKEHESDDDFDAD